MMKIAWNRWIGIAAMFAALGAFVIGAGEKTPSPLPNGLMVGVERNPESRIFAVHVLLRNRSAREPAGKEGLVDLAHRMLTLGTAHRDKDSLSRALDAIGAQVKTVDSPMITFDDYYTVPEWSYVRFQTIDTYSTVGLGLLAEMLFQPALTEANLQEARRALAQVQARQERDPRNAGQLALLQALFPGTWKGRPVYGTPASLASITLEDLRTFWPEYFRPANMIWTVQTNRPEAEVRKEIQAVTNASGAATPTQRADLPFAPPAAPPQPIRLELKGKQDYVLAGKAFRVDPKDAPALEVLTDLFSDALSFELREKRGLAYSLGAGVSWLNRGDLALLQISMGTRPENLAAAREGIQEQWKHFGGGALNEHDLRKAVNKLKGRTLMRWIPSLSRAYFMGVAMFQDQPPDAYRKRLSRLDKVSLADLLRVRQRYFVPGSFQWVLVE
jgi:zinc protease